MPNETALRRFYDDHAWRLYTYCLRVTGSHGAAVDALRDVVAAVEAGPSVPARPELLRAARRACLLRVEPVEADAPPSATDPRDAGRAPRDAGDVRRAAALLPPRQRELLALREVEGASYAEIGEVMGITREIAAQLSWRALLNLEGTVRRGGAFSVAPVPADCERALVLLTLAEDGPLGGGEQASLDLHLNGCEACTSARGALVAAAATYRRWPAEEGVPVTLDELSEASRGWGGGRHLVVLLMLGCLAALVLGVGIFAIARAGTDPVVEEAKRTAPEPLPAVASPPEPAAEVPSGEARRGPRAKRVLASTRDVSRGASPPIARGPASVERPLQRPAAPPAARSRRSRRPAPAAAPRRGRKAPASSVPPRRSAPATPVAAPPTQAAVAAPVQSTAPAPVAATATTPQPQPQPAAPDPVPAAAPPATQPDAPPDDSCARRVGNRGNGNGQGRPACPGHGSGKPNGPKR